MTLRRSKTDERIATKSESLWRYLRYFYFRLFKWFENQRTGSPDPYNVAAYLLILLIWMQLFCVAMAAYVFLNAGFVFPVQQRHLVLLYGSLMVVFMWAAHVLFVSNGRWRAIIREFEQMSTDAARTADRVFRGFVAFSLTMLFLGVGIAAYAGLTHKVP